MIEAYKKYWIKFADFKTRSSRGDYWFVVLMNFIISFALSVILGLFGIEIVKTSFDFKNFASAFELGPGYYISLIWGLINLIPALAVAVRRLHDTNRSGWWIFICLIPFVGFIWYLVLLCLGSVSENNRYGSSK